MSSLKLHGIKYIKYLLKARIEYIKEILILYDLFNDKVQFTRDYTG